jgi:diguanylate cyclase (GGDEF)-like protein
VTESRARLDCLNIWLAGLQRVRQLLLAILLLFACALADYATGKELSVSITYLAPTALAAWYAGRTAGYIMAVAASITWLSIDLLSGPVYSQPMIPIWNCLVRLGFFLIVTSLLLQVRMLLGRLQDQAATDGLTGLANSHSFHARLDLERERSLRYRHPFTVAYLDLDHFKQVNDTWGHATGDRVLQAIAGTLAAGLRRTDMVARLGGDEFAILLAETGADEASEALQKLHARLLGAMAEHAWPVGCSIGALTCINPASIGVHELIQQADDLMYQVKRGGKNRVKLVALEALHE